MFEFTQSLFFWTLINFILLLFLINKFALPAFYKMVEESAQKKEQAQAELEQYRLNAERLMKEYEEKLANIKTQAQDILNQARLEKEEMKKQELQRLLSEKQAILSGIKEEIQNEKKKFIQNMKEEAADLVISAARKIIQQELKASDHDAIIRQNLTDFETLVNS